MNVYDASVIIPTYNRLNELELTLNSLLAQKCKYKFEVIVADDGSKENTKSIVDKYVGQLNIRYCYQEDLGFRAGAARNMGIRLSNGDICIFIDNGIILHSRALESHIDVHKMKTAPCVVIGYVYAFLVDEERIAELLEIITNNTPDDAINIMHDNGFHDTRETYYQELGYDLSKWPAPFTICWSCNISVKKEMLIEVGMFDEFFVGWGHEDQELGISLYRSNVEFILSQEASSIHFPHEKQDLSINSIKNYKFHEIQNILKRGEYIRTKHPIREVEVYVENWDPFNVNKILLKERHD